MSEIIQVNETESNDRDVISNLPESIVSHILSILPTKDAVRTCVLSKDWEYKWTNMQIIDIDERSRTRNESFFKFVDKILLLCPLKRFHLVCWQQYDKDHMVTWISDLLRKNVESIEITWDYSDIDIAIPRCLMNCTSLKNLKLQNLPCTLNIPVINWFSHLTDLYLAGVRIVNELFPNTNQLTFTFPVLESMELHHCKWLNVEVVEINAPALNRLTVTKFVLEEGSYQIKISAAKLSKFETSGSFLENIVLSESSVDYATFGIQGWDMHDSKTATQKGLQARKLLKGFLGVKYLSISGEILTALSCTKGELLPRFDELKQLEVGIKNNEAFFELLAAAPSLEKLILDMKWWYDNEQFELEPVPPCVASHLKEVKFNYFNGSRDEVRLAKCFLDNTPNLKKMLGLVRKKSKKNPHRNSFWVTLKRSFENGDLEVGDDVKSMADFEKAFGGDNIVLG